MKKLILGLLFLNSILCFSQEHMSFKNVEMNCSAQKYIQKLGQKDLYLVSEEKSKYQNVYTLQGPFATTDDCTIKVYCHHNDSIVGKVVIIFPKEESWAKTKETYKYLWHIYIYKYGDPTIDRWSFGSPFYDGDGKEFEGLEKRRICIISYWKDLSAGLIKLEVNMSGRIEISYEDKINWYKIQDSNRKEIFNEI